MELIDWRDLYAANRAVIEGRPPPDAHGPTSARPARRPASDLERREVHDGRRARSVFLYTPPGLDAATAAPLVVALHGCTQTAATFAAGSLLNRAADAHGFVVAYPEQGREDNPQGCWNWFSASHQARGGGEPAFIATAVRALLDGPGRCPLDPRRVFVAGMSAGGAMAAVMAATHPDLFAAVAVHSGLPFACARTLPAATQAMTRGADDPEALGRAALHAMGDRARVMPVLVVHGSADRLVSPVNGEHVTRQWLEANRVASGGAFAGEYARPAASEREHQARGLGWIHRTWTDRGGRVVQEHIDVEGLGHAWSGGAPGGSYTDPRGPSAADAIWRFFARVAGRDDEARRTIASSSVLTG